MKVLLSLLLLLGFLPATLPAADHVLLTIYDQNYAVVRDVRTFNLVAGENEIHFTDISPLILEEPVRLYGDSLLLLEQAFRYHHVTDDLLLNDYLGKRLDFYLRDSSTVSGVLVGDPGEDQNGTAFFMVKLADGAVRTIRQDEVQNYRFPELPSDYQTKPELTFKIRCPETGKREVEAAYEVLGLNWDARYLLELSGSDSVAVFSGSAVVWNSAGKTFDHARITFATGQTNTPPKRLRLSTDRRIAATNSLLAKQPGFKVDPEGQMHVRGGRSNGMLVKADGVDFRDPMMVAASAESASHEQLFGLQFYTLPLETSLPNGLEKEFSLFAPATIKTRTSYEYAWWKSPNRIGVFAHTVNSDSVGLGMPLPAGPVKIYRARENGATEYVGEDRLAAVAEKDPILIRVGFAEGVSVSRASLASESKWNGRQDNTREVRIRNDRDTDVKIDVLEQFGEQWKILESSAPYEEIAKHLIKFPVTVPAEKELVLTYRVRTWHAWKK